MTIVYRFQDSLYVNVTNKCPCACVFCVRKEHDSIGACDSLWLEREPSSEEVIEAFKDQDLSKYKAIVFCGYGEPLERIDVVLEVCKYLKQITSLPIRINTNGLADLIWGRETAPLLEGLVDCVSISLNAPTKQRYNEIVKPRLSYREHGFESMLHFASMCKAYVGDVQFTVVDVINEEEILKCKQLAESMNIPLRVRAFIA